ncbi:MAG: hypothetical protein N3C12_14340 [Candidatus Binatia bacterium]|nr:hypothetical protein [Candidatus Binatia bacterium]
MRRPRATARSRTRAGAWALLLVAVFAAALSLRLAYIQSIIDSPASVILQTNALRYHTWAQAILNGTAPSPPHDQPPAYAYLMATIYYFGGVDPLHVRIVQAVVDAMQCVLLASLAGQVGSMRWAWSTGLVAAAYGPSIFFTGELLPATFSLAALTAALVACVRHSWLLAGALFLVASALRVEFLLAVVAYAAWLAFRGQRQPAKRLLLPLAIGWLGITLTTSLVAGRPVPYTTGVGLNLWLGNNPFADGVNPFPPAALRAAADRARAEAHNDPVTTDWWFLREAVAFWRAYPFQAVALAWKKLRWTLVDRELPNTSDVDWQQSYSWLFRLPLFPVSFGAVLMLASAGLVFSLIRRKWSEALTPLSFVAAGTLFVCTVFFTNGRFRLPLAPLLLILAGHCIACVTQRPCFRHPTREVLLSGVAVAGAAWLAFADPYKVKTYAVPALLANAGIAERLTGRFERARDYLRQALAADRADDLAWAHLALAQEQLGDPVAAAEAYFEGFGFVPHSEDLRELARQFSARHGVDPIWIDQWVGARSAAEQQALRRRILQLLRTREP